MQYLRFSKSSILWFKFYLSVRKFQVNLDYSFSSPGDLNCGVPQGSILGPLLFLPYVNNMQQAAKCNIYLYADDTCLVFQHKVVKESEKQLNKDFSNPCNWFIDNKLSIRFGDDKTKSILFAPKHKIKKLEATEFSLQKH